MFYGYIGGSDTSFRLLFNIHVNMYTEMYNTIHICVVAQL